MTVFTYEKEFTEKYLFVGAEFESRATTWTITEVKEHVVHFKISGEDYTSKKTQSRTKNDFLAILNHANQNDNLISFSVPPEGL